MPRITADSIAEHVARQEAAVFDAAVGLFTERGYASVSFADIAAEVGLARTSLYRYFPGKVHILGRWLQRELAAELERSQRVLAGGGTPRERIRRWATDRLDYARRPEHALIASLPDVVGDLDEHTRAALADSHRRQLEPLFEALVDAGLTDDAARATAADLINGLVLAAARREARLGSDDEITRGQLAAAIDGLLAAAMPRRPRPT